MTLRGMFTPAPTCSPTRHALYTGLYPIRSGAYPNHTMVDPGTTSIFTDLKALGYRVGLQAKSHVHPPSSFPYENISNNADDAAALARFVGRDESQPWLAVFASHDPHGPWTRGPKDLYDPASLKLPPWMHDNAETRARWRPTTPRSPSSTRRWARASRSSTSRARRTTRSSCS